MTEEEQRIPVPKSVKRQEGNRGDDKRGQPIEFVKNFKRFKFQFAKT